MIKLILFFFIPSSAFAGNSLAGQGIDTSNINDLIQRQSKSVKDISPNIIKENKFKYNIAELEALKIQRDDITNSDTHLAFIKRGSKLINLWTGKIRYTQKDLKVLAHKKLDFNGFVYLQDKSGNVNYKIYRSLVSNISEITDLYENPDNFTKVEKKIETKINDDSFKYELALKLHIGQNRPSFTNDLLSDQITSNAVTRYEISLLTNHNLSFHAGFGLMFETLSGNLKQSGEYNVKSLSLGPSIESRRFFKSYYLILQPRASIYSQAITRFSNTTEKYNFTETSLLFALEKEMQTISLGKFTFGISFQRKWINTFDNQVSVNLDSSNNYDDSISFNFGHRSGWVW